MPGVNQVNVNEKAGLTFAVALKAFLRQDPDVIMVGEIRDLETADIAIKAAQTGHLVLSTLHTNDAPTTLTRMRNMGIAPFNIASSVILITAQRLARRLCPQCKQPADIPHENLLEAGYREEDIDGSWITYKPVGCPACNNGYKGRVGIYEVMPISGELQRIILQDGSALEIAAQARAEGVRSLRQSGLQKARMGFTSLEEVLAVTNEYFQGERTPWRQLRPKASRISSSNGKARTATARSCAASCAPAARTRCRPACAARACCPPGSRSGACARARRSSPRTSPCSRARWPR